MPLYLDAVRGAGHASKEEASHHLQELARLSSVPSLRPVLLRRNLLPSLLARLQASVDSRLDSRSLLIITLHLTLHNDLSLPAADAAQLQPLILMLQSAEASAGIAPPRALLFDPALIDPFRHLLLAAAAAAAALAHLHPDL